MGDSTFIKRIKLTNFLSFGPEGMEIDLKPLNVIIGANATGKSNLIEAFSFLNALPLDVYVYFDNRNPIEWLWKGSEIPQAAEIEVDIDLAGQLLNHNISFRVEQDTHRFILCEEKIGILKNSKGERVTESIYKFKFGTMPELKGDPLEDITFFNDDATPDRIQPHDQSILLQKSLYHISDELQWLNELYMNMYIYSDWDFSKNSPGRKPQSYRAHSIFLDQKISNLVMVLNDILSNHPDAFSSISRYLQAIYPDIDRIVTDFSSAHGYGIIKIHERGLKHPILATHFSDGLLRYLCLLTVLCHPKPPKLVCIEEPEIGLHPDAIVELAKLLKEASERTQLIITTHSDILISQLTDVPDSVIVCERDEEGTHMKRLDPEKLETWLKDDYLGDVWLSGGIGGTL